MMKICEENHEELKVRDLKAGDMFSLTRLVGTQPSDEPRFLMTDEVINYNRSVSIDLLSGMTWHIAFNEKVIHYPNACIKLGEPKEYK